MRTLMHAFFLLLLTVTTSAGQASNPFFSIVLTGPQTVKPGESVEVKAVLTNTSDQLLDFMTYDEDVDYSLEVFKSTGRPAGYTTHGLFIANHVCKLVKGDTGNAGLCVSLTAGSHLRVTLQPGYKYIDWITVNDQFHLNEPGDYSIRVSRITAGKPGTQIRGVSNTITVTVAPAIAD